MPAAESLTDANPVIVVADDPRTARDAGEVAAAAGGHVVATFGWHELRTALERPAALILLMLDGMARDELQNELDGLVASMPSETRFVIAFGFDQLDTAGEALLGSGATLLCDPSPAELTAACALALSQRGRRVADASREAERLARLNEEVARIAETLAQLARRDDEMIGAAPVKPVIGDRAPQSGAQPASVAIDPADIRRAIRGRRLRDEIFGVTGLFEDPAWDMLLDLFAAELEQRAVSVSSLCIAAAVAPTTALRWIGRMLDNGLFDRQPDPRDRRRAHIALTQQASSAMHDYIAAARRAGVALA